MTDDLKPCPFCGSAPEIYKDEIAEEWDMPEEWFVECTKPEDECPVMVLGGPYSNREEAVRMWNTRKGA